MLGEGAKSTALDRGPAKVQHGLHWLSAIVAFCFALYPGTLGWHPVMLSLGMHNSYLKRLERFACTLHMLCRVRPLL